MRKTSTSIITYKQVKSIELTAGNFREQVLRSHKPVLVEFTADWCGSCHIIAPMIEKVMRQFTTRVNFGRIDYDSNRDLAKQYGISKLPALILFQDGKVVDYILETATKSCLTAKLTSMVDFRTGARQSKNK